MLFAFATPVLWGKDAQLPTPELEGYWYGTLNIGGNDYRRAYSFETGKDGAASAYLDDIELGQFHLPYEKIKFKNRHTKMELNGEIDDVVLNVQDLTMSGTVKKHGKTAILNLKKGLNYTLPRVDDNGKAATDYVYQIPQTLSDGWPVGDLRKSRFDIGTVEKGIHEILDQKMPNFHSLLIVQGGQLLLDEYFYGYGPDETHQLQSVAKSILSAVFGIAQDKGIVRKEQKIYDFFPEYRKRPGWDPRKDKITLGTLLSMSSGFDGKTEDGTWGAADKLDYSLSRPLTNEPGKVFNYDSTILCLLIAALTQKTGMSYEDFSQKYLFAPLSIQPTHWGHDAGSVNLSFDFWLKPRDMAKVGYLYLKKGKWNGLQVIPEKWVEESTEKQAPTFLGNSEGRAAFPFDYGYLWWRRKMTYKNRDIPVIYATGKGGQSIYIVPDLDLVCVFTGGNYDEKPNAQGFDFFQSYIVDAFH